MVKFKSFIEQFFDIVKYPSIQIVWKIGNATYWVTGYSRGDIYCSWRAPFGKRLEDFTFQAHDSINLVDVQFIRHRKVQSERKVSTILLCSESSSVTRGS